MLACAVLKLVFSSITNITWEEAGTCAFAGRLQVKTINMAKSKKHIAEVSRLDREGTLLAWLREDGIKKGLLCSG
jgi:hypothetical protein